MPLSPTSLQRCDYQYPVRRHFVLSLSAWNGARKLAAFFERGARRNAFHRRRLSPSGVLLPCQQNRAQSFHKLLPAFGSRQSGKYRLHTRASQRELVLHPIRLANHLTRSLACPPKICGLTKAFATNTSKFKMLTQRSPVPQQNSSSKFCMSTSG